MKTLKDESRNIVKISGKLLDIDFVEFKKPDNIYEKATAKVRVEQAYQGKVEVEEVSVVIFSGKFKKSDGTVSKIYEKIQEMKTWKSAKNVGIDSADYVTFTNCTLKENMFKSKRGTFIDTIQIEGRFCDKSFSENSVAGYEVVAYILDIIDEETSDGDNTGRVIVKAALVHGNEQISVINFIAESEDSVRHVTQDWNAGDTVMLKGYIRRTVVEDQVESVSTGCWGESADVSARGPRVVEELILTGGSEVGFDEDFAYDETEIRRGFNERKARIEQIMSESKPKAQAQTENKRRWE